MKHAEAAKEFMKPDAYDAEEGTKENQASAKSVQSRATSKMIVEIPEGLHWYFQDLAIELTKENRRHGDKTRVTIKELVTEALEDFRRKQQS